MPDPQTAPTGETVEQSAPPITDPNRDAIIQKYEQTYFQPSAAEEPVVTETATESATVAPPQAQDEVLKALLAEVAQLKTQLTPKPPEAVTAPVTQEDWLKLLSEGKKSEGEQALAAVLGPKIQEQAVQQALALMQAEGAVNAFANEVRSKNPDLLPYEQYIALGANARIQSAQATGRIKNPADYVTVYKEAVNAEIENARKLNQQIRGAGALAATTRVAEVATNQTLKPNAVNIGREPQPAVTDDKSGQTATDYLAERSARQSKQRGLTA